MAENITDHIADDVRHQIKTGILPPGALVPSEHDLATQYGVGRQTIRTAMRKLEHERLLIVRPRRGRIVCGDETATWHQSFEHPDNTGLTSSDAWETDMENQGLDPSHTDLRVEELSATEFLATCLQVPVGTLLVGRYRVRYLNGKPAITDDDFFVEEIVHGTEMAEPYPTTREDVLKGAGYEQTTDVDDIRPHALTLAEAQRLQLGTGEAVVQRVRIGHTPENQPVRVNIAIVPRGITLRYVLPT